MCRRLLIAAKAGDIQLAEKVIEEMDNQEVNLKDYQIPPMPLGPRAVHMLMTAYVRGGNVTGALDVAGKMQNDRGGVLHHQQRWLTAISRSFRSGQRPLQTGP